MSFYTEAIFSTDHLTLKCFEEKSPDQSELLSELNIPKEGMELRLRECAKSFPKKLKITMEPEEMIFKNVKMPLQDDKLLTQAIPFESRKYFRISEAEFVFTYHVWNRDAEGIHLTLLGISRGGMDKYIPLVKAGFFPGFTVKDFLSGEKGLTFHTKKIDQGKESLRFYYNGFLIGWNVHSKDDSEAAGAKAAEYIRDLGLAVPDQMEYGRGGELLGKSFSFAGPLREVIRGALRKSFVRLTAVFAVFLVFIFIISGLLQLNAKRQSLSRIEKQIRELQKEYQISDLQSIRKKANVKGVEMSRVIHAVEGRFPKDKKISRFEYKNGEFSITVRDTDVLEANRVKEALESENGFTQFRIEKGAVSNEQSVVFQVKR